MNPLTKKLLNSLRCPICKSLIDMLPTKISKRYQFGCAVNNEHYAIRLNNGDIERELVSFFDSKHKYVLLKSHYDGIISVSEGSITDMEINVIDIDLENRVVEGNKIKVIDVNSESFDFRNFNIKEVVYKINLLFLFQS
jgi:hypothetical protein